jgi:L-ascorbate metabolism protein UlaG (beta-lactamase superfamily)
MIKTSVKNYISMKLTRIDLNSWLFQMGGKTILVDPWLVAPLVIGLPWLFTAYHSQPPIYTPESLPKIDLILISQSVEDHCHLPTLERLDPTIPVVASASAAKIIRKLGFQEVRTLTHGQEFQLKNLSITAIRGAELQPGQVENGYFLKDMSSNETLYYEPHQAPLPGLKERLGEVTVAIAPVIGQIFPLLGQVIMGPEQALQLTQILEPHYFVPTALGDVRTSGILPPLIKTIGSVAEFRDRLLASGSTTKLLTPEPGETLEIS